MSIFNFKIEKRNQPLKLMGWKLTGVVKGRKRKECAICKRIIMPGDSATTFSEKYDENKKDEYHLYYTCGLLDSTCTLTLKTKLIKQSIDEKL